MKLADFAKWNIDSDIIYVVYTPYTPYQKNTRPDDYAGTIVKYHRGFDSYLAENRFGLSRLGESWIPGKSLKSQDLTGLHMFYGKFMSKNELLMKAHIMGFTPLYKFNETFRDFKDDRYLCWPCRLLTDELFRLERLI